MKHELPELPYGLEDLAPMMSKETLDCHYGKHLQTYIDNLNRMIEHSPYEDSSLEEIVTTATGGIFNNAAQAWNHIFFFSMMCPTGKAVTEKVAQKLEKAFGSVDKFKEEFTKTALTLFGSGWVWLAEDKEGNLVITQESNAGNPMVKGLRPILTLDVWEHAYYIDYRNRRAAYIEEWWKLIDWDKVEEKFL